VIVSIKFCGSNVIKRKRCFLSGKSLSIKTYFKSSQRDSIYLNNLELIIDCLLLFSIISLILFCTLMKLLWSAVPANHFHTVPNSLIPLFDLADINWD